MQNNSLNIKFEKFSDAVSSAKNVDILRFAEANGYNFKKTGRDRYTCIEHGSLVITPSKNMFYYFSGDFGGDTLDFVQKMMGISDFKDAVNFINSKDYVKFSCEMTTVLKGSYTYDKEKESKNFSKARSYLVNERKISADIVDYLHRKGLIKQDKKSNIIFPYINLDGGIVGAVVQGTYVKADGSTFKHIQENSEGDYGFSFLNGSPKNLKFFESPIDLLSYISIYKQDSEKMTDTWFIAMNGLKESVIQNYFKLAQEFFARGAIKQILSDQGKDINLVLDTLKEKSIDPESIKKILKQMNAEDGSYKAIQNYIVKNLLSVSACVDNDKWGIKFSNKIKTICTSIINVNYVNGIPDIPTQKLEVVDKWDWNNELKFQTDNTHVKTRFNVKSLTTNQKNIDSKHQNKQNNHQTQQAK